ncbi:putative cytochrome P450 [Phytophthora cinnamomi]|uniref:putative cytochrome P450 n=1 Tax=Phytophthora cinnamomi TaxID=4785 RepID=UPI00355966FC|nr:putative cytochrome P450 [Phytophthora cinnamomi]
MWGPLELALNVSPTSWGVLVCSLLLGWWFLSSRKQARALSKFARPASTLPVLGNTLDLMFQHRHDIHDWMLEECRRCEGRPWVLAALGSPTTVVLSDVEAFEDVLHRKFDNFGKCSAWLVSDVFGDGIFAADGVSWIHQRKTASHLFSLHMMRESMEQVVREQATVLCETLLAHCTSSQTSASTQQGIPVNLKYTMDWYATNVFTRVGFGVDMHSLSSQEHNEFFCAFTRLPIGIHRRVQQPGWLWRLKRALDMGDEKQLKLDMKRVDGVIYQVISQSMSSKSDAAPANPQRLPDLISLFLAKETNEYRDRDSTQENGSAATCRVETTPKLIRDMAFNFTAAGRGTTSQSLQWFIIMMNRYPDVEMKIREELLAKLPQLFEEDSTPPTMNDVQQLVYLEAAIKESLRLNPVAPLIGRTVTQDVVFSDGMFLPCGTRVVIPTFAVARLQSIWGEDAADFKPERWIDPQTRKLRVISPYKFLVFLAGPRSCLGAKLAMLELKVALASVLSKFHLRVMRDPFEIGYDASISLPVKGDVLAIVEAAEVGHLAGAA